MNDVSQKRFIWAVVLAWAPWLPTLIGLVRVFLPVSNPKATGLAAVAGGVAELLVIWGLLTMIVSQVVAIVWLYRGFSRTHLLRSVVSVVSIALSGLMLVLVCFFVWLMWFQARHI